MKNKTIELLYVDFIGGQDSLTKDEEKRINEFIKDHKLLRAKQQIRKTRTSPQPAPPKGGKKVVT